MCIQAGVCVKKELNWLLEIETYLSNIETWKLVFYLCINEVQGFFCETGTSF